MQIVLHVILEAIQCRMVLLMAEVVELVGTFQHLMRMILDEHDFLVLAVEFHQQLVDQPVFLLIVKHLGSGQLDVLLNCYSHQISLELLHLSLKNQILEDGLVLFVV